MADPEKSALVGRDYTQMEPHVGYDKRPENPHLKVIPEDSHINRAHGAMQRHAMPFRTEKEEGLYFIAFSRSLKEIDTALDRMSGQMDPKGSADALFSITKAITSNYYYAPSLREIEYLKTARLENEQKYPKESKQEEKMEMLKENQIKIFIEYCTNCGYVTIFNEKKNLLEKIDPRIVVFGNVKFPRLSAFEVSLEDGTVLWSKLNHPSGDGRNNYPHVFPTNPQILEAVEKHLGLKYLGEIPESLIYKEVCTRVGVW